MMAIICGLCGVLAIIGAALAAWYIVAMLKALNEEPYE